MYNMEVMFVHTAGTADYVKSRNIWS